MLVKLAHQLTNASRYSIDGMTYLLKSEFAARIEVYAFFWMMVALVLLGASWIVLGIAIILFLLLIATEALNTAIEVIIDRVSPEISPAGKKAKDLGSFAVMCISIANGVFFLGAVFKTPPVQTLVADLGLRFFA